MLWNLYLLQNYSSFGTINFNSSKDMSVIKSLKNVWLLYYEGFRNMTVGKSLWGIILLKLFIMFAILKVFFFSDFLKNNFKNDDQRSLYVIEQLTNDNISKF